MGLHCYWRRNVRISFHFRNERNMQRMAWDRFTSGEEVQINSYCWSISWNVNAKKTQESCPQPPMKMNVSRCNAALRQRLTSFVLSNPRTFDKLWVDCHTQPSVHDKPSSSSSYRHFFLKLKKYFSGQFFQSHKGGVVLRIGDTKIWALSTELKKNIAIK